MLAVRYAVDDLAACAIQALRDEAALYPKPGLVSPIDSGSHRDMNYAHFVDCIAVLPGYFRAIAAAGQQDAPFADLKTLGLQAEREMLVATGGVNTHRGAIFNLGLLCAAAAFLHSADIRPSPQRLGALIAHKWGADILQQRLRKPPADYSHGEHVEARYGFGGARLEAAQGYPSVVVHGLPAYRQALRQTNSMQAAAVQALFVIMREVDDTNTLWRAGPEGLRFVKDCAALFLDQGGAIVSGWQERAINIHRIFVSRRISPGGAADLLGATLFMHAVCD